MKIRIVKDRAEGVPAGVLILPVFEDGRGTDLIENRSLQKELKSILDTGQFKARVGDTYFLRTLGTIKPEALLLVGLGSQKDAKPEQLRRAGGQAGQFLKKLSLKDCTLQWDSLSEPVPFVEGLWLAMYTFSQYRQPESRGPETLLIIGKDTKRIDRSISELQGLIKGVFFARDLVNRPSNELGPEELADAALELKGRGVKVTVYDRKKIESFGMNAFLAVSKGSHRPPRLIVIEYKGGRKGPVALVGKSITFDSGGLSLKPSEAMEKMKYDMSGGAAVLGAIKAVREMELPVKVVGILAATDNMPGGGATRPGDVVKTITGKTVEILNTDAEGRLALADAIGFSKRFSPEVVVDIATLTGACVVALGPEAAALMSNSDPLAESLLEVSGHTGERLWKMPLFDDYKEYLRSDIADLRNIGGRAGGLITAAYFLKEFAEQTPWAHIDIASVAWSDKDRFYLTKGATGFGVRTFVEFLRRYKKP